MRLRLNCGESVESRYAMVGVAPIYFYCSAYGQAEESDDEIVFSDEEEDA